MLLRDLLAKVDATIGKKLHAEDLRDYVEVAGRDGYRVVFALAELDPSLQDNKVLVAISNEGKPLDDSIGTGTRDSAAGQASSAQCTAGDDDYVYGKRPSRLRKMSNRALCRRLKPAREEKFKDLQRRS